VDLKDVFLVLTMGALGTAKIQECFNLMSPL
jgi:hypothetical protein